MPCAVVPSHPGTRLGSSPCTHRRLWPELLPVRDRLTCVTCLLSPQLGLRRAFSRGRYVGPIRAPRTSGWAQPGIRGGGAAAHLEGHDKDAPGTGEGHSGSPCCGSRGLGTPVPSASGVSPVRRRRTGLRVVPDASSLNGGGMKPTESAAGRLRTLGTRLLWRRVRKT